MKRNRNDKVVTQKNKHWSSHQSQRKTSYTEAVSWIFDMYPAWIVGFLVLLMTKTFICQMGPPGPPGPPGAPAPPTPCPSPCTDKKCEPACIMACCFPERYPDYYKKDSNIKASKRSIDKQVFAKKHQRQTAENSYS